MILSSTRSERGTRVLAIFSTEFQRIFFKNTHSVFSFSLCLSSDPKKALLLSSTKNRTCPIGANEPD